MKLELKFLLIALLAIALAIPVSLAFKHRTQMLNLEKSQNGALKLQLKSDQKKAEEVQKELEKVKAEQQKQIDELNSQLQSKRNTQQTLATAQTRKASVAFSGGGNCEAYRGLVAQYNWNVDVALAVMRAESGCNPNAANLTDSHSTCTGSFGLFQIACFDGQVYDPAQNIAIAYRKYTASGWQPWSVCTRGVVSCG